MSRPGRTTLLGPVDPAFWASVLSAGGQEVGTGAVQASTGQQSAETLVVMSSRVSVSGHNHMDKGEAHINIVLLALASIAVV